MTVTYREHMHRCAREFLESLLSQHAGNITQAARAAGLNRTALHSKIKQLGLATKPAHRGEWHGLQ